MSLKTEHQIAIESAQLFNAAAGNTIALGIPLERSQGGVAWNPKRDLQNLVTCGVAAGRNVSHHIVDMAQVRLDPNAQPAHVSFANINTMLAKMGDARENISAFVMPTALLADLMGDSMGNYQFDRVLGVTIYQDVVQTFGRTVIAYDCPALILEKDGEDALDRYVVMGLGRNVLESRMPAGKISVEYTVSGMDWAKESAASSTAALGKPENWSETFDDHHSFKIVLGVFNSSIG